MGRIRHFAMVLLAVAAIATSVSAEPLLWKNVANAFLRVNDQGLKEWSVFQTEKQDDRFLLRIADRYLLVDATRRNVFALGTANIERSGPDVLWDPVNVPAKPLSTSEWLVRDVGFAKRIKMRLDSEDRTVDLQIPHKPTRP
jgi:hypothetical protein